MKLKLSAELILGREIPEAKGYIDKLLSEFNKGLKKDRINIERWSLDRNSLSLEITSTGKRRAHQALLQLKKILSERLGKEFHVGVRELKVRNYEIVFDVEKKILHDITIPFAKLEISNKEVRIFLESIDEEFLSKNYVDRIIKRVKEKIDAQHYEGKMEYWELIWKSEEREPIWNKNPSEEMQKLGWIVLLGKGKWFYNPPAVAIMRALERVIFEEVVRPLGFREVIEPMHVSFNTWLRTGHLEGMPGEIYYLCEPRSRDPAEWERFIDLVKITREVPERELLKNIKPPREGVVYAQCPNIYASMRGKTLAEDDLPLLLFERRTPSDRYESGGKRGIERVDEFWRIEIVYIGTKEQLLQLQEKLIERYKYIFDDILELEWRMARVTPFYMQQAGIVGREEEITKGTIDFEAKLPYRGEWLEFQNISIVGDKYTSAFNIKGQKSSLWSGCSGIGIERLMAVFLAQKGLNPRRWPEGFRKHLPKLPEMPKFL
jgi:seryl-tRNA synthetase